MKSGTCPKCGSSEVYSGEDLPLMTKQGAYWANSVPITGWHYGPLDNYVCCDCGYVESYVAQRKKLDKIRQKWPRVRVGGYDRTCPNCGAGVDGGWRVCPYCEQPLR